MERQIVNSLSPLRVVAGPGTGKTCALMRRVARLLEQQNAAVFQALGRRARPLMASEIDTLLCDLSPQFGGKKAVGKLIEAFEAYWARLQHHQPEWPADPN